MNSMLGPLPVYAWVAIAAGVAAFAGLHFWSISTPAELTGVDLRAGEAADLSLTAPAEKLRLWVRFELATDDEDPDAFVTLEARCAGRVVAQSDGAPREGARVWHGGGPGSAAFSDEVVTLRGLTPGATVELRIAVRSPVAIREARAFVTR